MTPELGIIEGFFGRPYSWDERADMVRALAPAGYGFYLYAPKADAYLRRRWREPYPAAELKALAAFAQVCRDAGVRFGVGLSPYELFLGFDGSAKDALAAKLDQLAGLGLADLGVFFDDMKGDLPDLAARQIEIVHWIAERAPTARIIACPSYYTDDPVLDRVFGQRPANYLEDLGAGLDPAIQLMWTGEEVCSREFSPGHLAKVAARMRRKPFIWDNYPVNDGPRMSRHLHLRAFTGRPASIAPHIAAHAVNPASQAVLSRIPALTLAESYSLGDHYQYLAAFQRAAQAVLDPDLADGVERTLLLLEDAGLDGITAEQKSRLHARFSAFDHPAAREILAWLDGAFAIGADELQTQ
ncbi:MAG: beta-N-acetylglucosaminidase domain-containing protein [Alphaproteobacteria bacterium]|nr:beta-N-acetylglucosaminidase domain-containing protein [Alphaproteobacteria bacterium]MBU1513137.1 beta-N-acetylglucosaminidase domain-containing protein [Alphaproteobacteria bacterium]MBU2095245.1 beta-N-acetylglucosaminidase domain-containing protein [Alphaproteobacteria bacterium]MBU2152160.1 beta-N-acetylglucosaminidase domain-containing protein [Alphaproteobacteria bacterium]MBU2306793.1 beta-N-acetylglucosaminidase domain-containing protein [Alphaproteobacteria bacterium]